MCHHFAKHSARDSVWIYLTSSKTFKDTENQTVLRRLIREVKGLNHDFITQHIHGELVIVWLIQSVAAP